MKNKELIEILQKLPLEAEVGWYNPIVDELYVIVKAEYSKFLDIVEIEVDDR